MTPKKKFLTMGRSCCVPGCKNRFIKGGANKRIRFFGFPKDGARRKEWFTFLGRSSDWIPRNQDAVWSVHFIDSCFNVQGGPKILKKTAIPSEVSPDIVSDSLLGVPDVEESFSVPKVMADICSIPLTMVPEIDNSLSGAAMGHFIIAESGRDTTDANLDSSQIETSVALPSTRKQKLDLDEIMGIPEVKMMRLENEQLINRISLLEKKLKAANRAKQYLTIPNNKYLEDRSKQHLWDLSQHCCHSKDFKWCRIWLGFPQVHPWL